MSPNHDRDVLSCLRAYRSILVAEGNPGLAAEVERVIGERPPARGGEMPKPRPGMSVLDDGDEEWSFAWVRRHADGRSVRNPMGGWTPWTPDHIREVRTPDGRVLWRAT